VTVGGVTAVGTTVSGATDVETTAGDVAVVVTAVGGVTESGTIVGKVPMADTRCVCCQSQTVVAAAQAGLEKPRKSVFRQNGAENYFRFRFSLHIPILRG